MISVSGYDVRIRTSTGARGNPNKKHCNFCRGKAHRNVSFYNMIIQPYGTYEFKKLMNLTLVKKNSVFVYIDDILMVTNGTKAKHLNEVRKVLTTLE